MSTINGLDPASLNHPATETPARAFQQADADLREMAGRRTAPRADLLRVENRYYAAMRALHEAEDAVKGEERRGMASRSLVDEIAARRLRAEGSYVLCAYRPAGYRRVEGEHVFVAYRRFDSLAAAVAYAEAEIIGPESGFLPWVPTGDHRQPGLVTDVWLHVENPVAARHRRINLTGQRWRVLEPVGSIGIQSAWAHDQHAGDRIAETAFGARPSQAEADLVKAAVLA